MTYEIVSTDTTPYGSEFYLSISAEEPSQEFQELPNDYSDVYKAVENEFYSLLDDDYSEVDIPLLGTFSMGELFYRLASETDQRVYIGDFVAQCYSQATFVEALNATQEATELHYLVPDVEPGEPDSALELLVDLDRDTRVVVELSPRGVRYRPPRELGIYKRARREWHSMDTDEVDGLTLTELLDKIYEKLSE